MLSIAGPVWKGNVSMQIVHCDGNRDRIQQTIYRCGELKYEYESDFAKNLPGSIVSASIAGGCCSPSGEVFAGVRGNPSGFLHLDQEGSFVKLFATELFSEHLHFAKYTDHDTMLCADSYHHVVREFTLDGAHVRDFGSYDCPSDTGLDMGYLPRTRRYGGIYPTEPFIGIVPMWAFHEGMRKVCRVAEPFNMPTDVDQLSDSTIVVADGYGNRAVHLFDYDSGKLVKTFGGVGVWDTETDTPGQFLVVHALAVDSKDHIWVCDREKDAVHVFDRDGNVVGYCRGNMGQPSGVDTDGTYIYVVGRGGYLTIFDADVNIVAQLGTFNCDLRAHDIAADANGNLYLFPTHANEDHQIISLRRLSE